MMQSKVVLHIRNPFLLDASTYISTGVMALLGISGLPTFLLQVIALALCLTFALLYRFMFRTGWYERNPLVYFGIQTVILTILLLLRSDANDAFNFLFYILTVHATVVLQARTAAVWIAGFFVIASAVVILSRGLEGIYAVFFYLAAFVVCGIFGHTVQQTELTSERNQQLLDELKEAQQKLQELAVLEERNRLARDLHDSVKQQVFAISMQLGAARTALSESDKAYPSVVEAERLAQQAGAELTSLINALRPPGLERRVLTDAIRGHVEEWSRQNKIEAEIKIDSDVAVNLQTEQALFRVLQEALSNVARHSQASKATITLKSDNENILLMIEDNGVGYDAERIAKGIGLDSMKERMAAVNGELQISSIQSLGTRVIATVRKSQ
ncbi:MAG: sensor histidine kinase [Chloroflexi bacterium]|nr:sensor histidine kinase [Chloroflexota bacterium]